MDQLHLEYLGHLEYLEHLERLEDLLDPEVQCHLEFHLIYIVLLGRLYGLLLELNNSLH